MSTATNRISSSNRRELLTRANLARDLLRDCRICGGSKHDFTARTHPGD
jgi:hypothetical protein